jgi:hypothetical protein
LKALGLRADLSKAEDCSREILALNSSLTIASATDSQVWAQRKPTFSAQNWDSPLALWKGENGFAGLRTNLVLSPR